MNWLSWSDFWNMGGYGWYVWTSFSVFGFSLIAEIGNVKSRHRRALQSICKQQIISPQRALEQDQAFALLALETQRQLSEQAETREQNIDVDQRLKSSFEDSSLENLSSINSVQLNLGPANSNVTTTASRIQYEWASEIR
ncbi:heme exporter protein CcmD [Undibacterium flavidum]|uniref:Heme exporter protein D n=1 Tax=Undibacterium flavidum TaxID=2762297 RepID=A0ABR6YAF1_9BURK|nr:heme exporter protein CcmD [Undibacterium flavidum]MBC3873172.1 heme exporter protein CcmD [Undibacterium flavidum]